MTETEKRLVEAHDILKQVLTANPLHHQQLGHHAEGMVNCAIELSRRETMLADLQLQNDRWIAVYSLLREGVARIEAAINQDKTPAARDSDNVPEASSVPKE